MVCVCVRVCAYVCVCVYHVLAYVYACLIVRAYNNDKCNIHLYNIYRYTLIIN